MTPKTLVMGLALLLAAVPVAHAQDSSLAEVDALYEAGAYVQAVEGYRHVLAATAEAKTRAWCLLRLGDCWQHGEPFGDEMADAFYAQALDQGYSPYLAEAYHKWRAATQMLWHGVSNFSEIPTEEYQARKQQVLAIIAAHLRTVPDDPTALAQQDALRQLPDIQRGGPMGSSVLNEMGLLWPEISS